MEFNIGVEKKTDIINGLIQATLSDIYRYALALNIAPETLTTDWEPPAGHDYNENEVNFLKKSLARLASLQERQASL